METDRPRTIVMQFEINGDEMNDFDNDNLYELSAAEGKRNAQGLITALLYLVLAAVVIITGAHAVMLVLSQTAAYSFAGQSSMITTVLTAIRVAFPLLVEAAAVVAGIGFIQARWRGPQKTVGLGIELTWLIFAALNMITFFAVERGAPLQSWQTLWVQYGLPLSALIAGSLTYTLLRVDPTHKRETERTATAEQVDAMRFKFFQKARLSPAMLNIEKQRAFMMVVDDLRRQGYTEQQIGFMISHTPELLADGDENGTPDVLQVSQPVVGQNTYTPPQAIPLAHPVEGGGNGPAAKPLGKPATGAPRDFR